MKELTQHDRIILMMSDMGWHCQNEFHPISWCPHKRRAEIAEKGFYNFKERPCEHGIKGSKDFRMYLVNPSEKWDNFDIDVPPKEVPKAPTPILYRPEHERIDLPLWQDSREKVGQNDWNRKEISQQNLGL